MKIDHHLTKGIMARHLQTPVRKGQRFYKKLVAQQEDVMDSVRQLTHAYSNTPWRKQTQYLAVILLVLVLGLSVASIYLTVSARAVTAGFAIKNMLSDMEENKRVIADMETQLAYLTSEEVMKARAKDLGYQPATAEQIIYIEVPGYSGRQGPIMEKPPLPEEVAPPVVSTASTGTLFDWLVENITKPSALLKELSPWK